MVLLSFKDVRRYRSWIAFLTANFAVVSAAITLFSSLIAITFYFGYLTIIDGDIFAEIEYTDLIKFIVSIAAVLGFAVPMGYYIYDTLMIIRERFKYKNMITAITLLLPYVVFVLVLFVGREIRTALIFVNISFMNYMGIFLFASSLWASKKAERLTSLYSIGAFIATLVVAAFLFGIMNSSGPSSFSIQII